MTEREPGAPRRGGAPERGAGERTEVRPPGRRRRWALWLAVLPALLVLSVRVGWVHHLGLGPDLVLDDAYISFRYAQNLVRGEGLVFNPGERVEGYTNFLWTVLVAGAMAAGAEPEPAAEAFAGLAAVGSLLLLAGLGRRLLRGPLAATAAVLPPLLFAALESQARHVLSGMETLLFVFLVLAAFSCLLWRWRSAPEPPAGGVVGTRAAVAAGLLFALATMTRPEGAMFAGLGGLFVLFGATGGAGAFRRLRPRLGTAAVLTGSFLALYGPYTAWRVSYYGHPLPNTFYAKVAGPYPEVVARGWQSLGEVMAQWPVWPLLVLAALALVPIGATRRDPVWAWLLGIALVTWTSFVLVGGDFLVFFGPRMLMPALPFVLLAAAEGARRTARAVSSGAAGRALLAAALVGLALHALARPWPHRVGHLQGLATTHRALHEVAAWLVREEPSGASLAAAGVGIVPYVTGWPTLDMYGLVDEHVAHHGGFDPDQPPGHARSDPAYVLDRRPEYLLSNLGPTGIPRAAKLGWVADRVGREYELVAQVKKGRGGLVEGRRLVEVERFRRELYRRGYRMGILRRIGRGA